MVKVAFPNLGISEFILDPVAFSLFGLEVRWYGLVIVTGMIAAFFYARFRAHMEGIDDDNLLDFFLFAVIFGVIGARFYYVVTSLDQYDSIGEMFAIWNGGLGIYGGIIFGAAAVIGVSIHKKIPFMRALDMASLPVMIGQTVGRWGNFFNGEAFGHTDKFELFGLVAKTPGAEKLPWIMQVNSYASDYETVLVHPTFLYESVWNLIGFIIINALYKKKKFDGQVMFMYIGWYGLGRMFIEALRADSLRVGGVKISQLVGLLAFLASAVALTYMLIKKKNSPSMFEGRAKENKTEEDQNGTDN